MTVMSFPEDFISHFAEKTGGVVIMGDGNGKEKVEASRDSGDELVIYIERERERRKHGMVIL